MADYPALTVPTPGENKAVICDIPGCSRPVKYTSLGWCNTHYERHRRSGSTSDPIRPKPEGKTWRTVAGYITVRDTPHPLADARGTVLLHRRNLYDAIGPGVHPCHWCAKPVTWGLDLHVDHLDWDKSNNDPSNLVPSCNRCNASRQPAVRGRRTPIEHGTRKEYAKGCRCDACRTASAAYAYSLRKRSA